MATAQPTSTGAPTEKRDFRQEVTDSIVRMLEQGVAPWQKLWDADAIQIPLNPTSNKPYRGGNALHLIGVGMRRGYSDPRWTTYKQATESGWQVQKGEKGTQIEFWDFSQPERQPIRDATESAPGGSMEEARAASRLDGHKPIHRVYTVFNAQQIDGIPKYEHKVHTSFEVVQSGEAILRNSGAAIEHDQRDRAYYSRSSDTIHLPRKEAFKDASGYYGTALHELAHWTGAPSRLNRTTLTESYRFGDLNYAREELRAEIASVFIAAERGVPHDPGSHAAYVGSWIKALKDDKHEIFRAAHDASRAADYVLALERAQAVAEAVEVAAPDRVDPSDPSISTAEQTARSVEVIAAAAAPIERQIDEMKVDRNLVADREIKADSAVAPEVETVLESDQLTARHNLDNGTMIAHQEQGSAEGQALADRIQHNDGHARTHTGAGEKSPSRDQLAISFDNARKAAVEVLGDTARTTSALTSSGTYRGKIIAETDHHMLQQISSQTAVAHMKHALTPLPIVGESVVVAYSSSKAAVTEFRQRDRSPQLAR